MENKEKAKETKREKGKLKKLVALGTMFSVGVSAFAAGTGNGRLWEVGSTSYNQDAVTDIVFLVDTIKEANMDRKLSAEEQNLIKKLQSDYDKNYGEGACKFVIDTMNGVMKSHPNLGFEGAAKLSVIKSAETQKSAETLDVTLKTAKNPYDFSR